MLTALLVIGAILSVLVWVFISCTLGMRINCHPQPTWAELRDFWRWFLLRSWRERKYPKGYSADVRPEENTAIVYYKGDWIGTLHFGWLEWRVKDFIRQHQQDGKSRFESERA